MRQPMRSSRPFLLFFSMTLLSLNGGHFVWATSANKSVRSGPADYVNAFVGTLVEKSVYDAGNTYPGAALPLGMMQWSPDTANAFSRPEKHAGSYIYDDDVIRGFSLTHLGGTGCPAEGDVPIIPVPGAITSSPGTDATTYWAKFSHSNEEASPGFYSVGFDNGSKVELTVTTRSGFGRFTFPASANSNLLIDVGRNATGVRESMLEFTGTREISGRVASGAICGAPNRYTVYFAAEFNRSFTGFGTWNGPTLNEGRRSVTGPNAGGFVRFDTTKDHVVKMKIALSYASIANAQKNLDKEIPDWDFDAVRQAAHDKWNHELGRISVSGGTVDEMRMFYTSLYRVFLHPNTFSDVNGEYIGFDNKIHVAKGFTLYANYSGWDIYRTEIQLLAMLVPKETSDMVESLVVDEHQGGGLPIWPIANDDTCSMVGSPSCAIITDAYAFGARTFDTKAALAAMLKGATQPGVRCNHCLEWDGLDTYLKLGYLPPDTPGQGPYSGPSQTLEFTTADFSIAQFAKALRDTGTYRTFMKRAQFWKNIFDAKTGYIEPRLSDGSFVHVDPALSKYYVEGNAAQYSWMVPYNLRDLFDLMGGNTKVVKRLDSFFTELNAGADRPYFWIGNEPVFAVPWAYDFAGTPWRSQAIARRVETELFTPTPEGEPGNDDLGAMSAWYVFAALGVYPAIPGVGGLALNSPLFPSVTIHLGNGKIVRIEAENASALNPYIQSLRVNGKPSESTWLPYEVLSRGVKVQFMLGNTPNKEWGTKPEDAPPSFAEAIHSRDALRSLFWWFHPSFRK